MIRFRPFSAALRDFLASALLLVALPALGPGGSSAAPEERGALPEERTAAASAPRAADSPAEEPIDRFPHRRQEAEAKARSLQRSLERPSLRTPNQDLFDVQSYELDLTLTPTTSNLSGTVTTEAKVLAGPVSTLDFNLKANMAVSTVTAGGVTTSFTRAADILTVNLDRAYATDEIVVVDVTYSGNPAGESFGWDSHLGQPMVWTLSEPFGARDWWPCIDHNDDKANQVDIVVTVPDNLIVASNGLMLSDVDNGTTRTFHWQTQYPMATYLVSLAVHPFTRFSHSYTPQGGGAPMPVEYFVFSDHFASGQATYGLTVPMIDAFAGSFGEYPFVNEKYGHAEFLWPGGMEHQTLTSLGGFSEDLISHELAHQWWGDMITCDTFNHIWLNEGFATWCEAYWRELTAGPATYRDYMDGAAYFGAGTVYVENTTDFNSIFDGNLSYNKASWVVHMLRGVLGDQDFFDGLAHYRSLYEGSTATTENLRDAMEFVSGVDLDAFFQQWIYGEYFPSYRGSWAPAVGGVDLTIEQIQTNTGLFTMPIRVRVVSTSGTFDFTVQNAAAVENYNLTVAGTVSDVQIDPDRWILRQVESAVSNPTFDQGILLVNGIDWATYGAEVTSAYADSAFWNDHPIHFWDTFAAPPGGYPANVPTPLGHGSVPAGVLGSHSAVVWVGNNFNGDLTDWTESPVKSYLAVGGNLLLVSRQGTSFIDNELRTLLGITWTNTGVTLSNCTAQAAGLVNMTFLGSQSLCDTFSPTVGPNSTLLFRDTFNATRGTGVIVEPPGGGTVRPDGGKFAFISGRPYRMNHASLRANIDYILEHYFGEPYVSPVGVPELALPGAGLSLSPPRPNPTRVATDLNFSIPTAADVAVDVYDVSGRRVKTLVDEFRAAGAGSVAWDGRDNAGNVVSPGTYFVRILSRGEGVTRSVVLLR